MQNDIDQAADRKKLSAAQTYALLAASQKITEARAARKQVAKSSREFRELLDSITAEFGIKPADLAGWYLSADFKTLDRRQ